MLLIYLLPAKKKMMSSEVVSGIGLEVLEINSYSHGHYNYMNIWEPDIGELLVANVK